jgi:hypothetical protein
MLSSRFAGIPVSSSIIDQAGVPQLLVAAQFVLELILARSPAR